MSSENAALKDRVIAAVLGGDMAALPALFHPAFEMRQASALPYAGVYRGPAGFVDFIGRFMGTYDLEALDTVATFVSDTGALVVEIVIRGVLKGTTQRIDTTILEKWEFADGRVRRITPHYFDPAPC